MITLVLNFRITYFLGKILQTTMKQKKAKIFHTIGSPDTELFYKLSLNRAKACVGSGEYEFHFALIHPSGKVSFPTGLDDASLDACKEKHHFETIFQRIREVQPIAIIHHLYGIKGCTSYRAALEILDIPIIGSTADKHYITTNKATTRAILRSAGVSVPPGVEILHKEEATENLIDSMEKDYGYPLVVKASTVEDSVGVRIAGSRQQNATRRWN